MLGRPGDKSAVFHDRTVLYQVGFVISQHHCHLRINPTKYKYPPCTPEYVDNQCLKGKKCLPDPYIPLYSSKENKLRKERHSIILEYFTGLRHRAPKNKSQDIYPT